MAEENSGSRRVEVDKQATLRLKIPSCEHRDWHLRILGLPIEDPTNTDLPGDKKHLSS